MPPPGIYKKIFRFIGGGDDGFTILNSASEDGVGVEVNVSQWRHIGVEISSDSSAELTVNCQGSYQSLDNIDFSAIQSTANPWDNVGMFDTQTGLFIRGDTGIVFTGTDDVRLFLINQDCFRSINFIVSGWSVGGVTVKIFPVNNQ